MTRFPPTLIREDPHYLTYTGLVSLIQDGVYEREYYDKVATVFGISARIANDTQLAEGETWVTTIMEDGSTVRGQIVLTYTDGCLKYTVWDDPTTYVLQCVNQSDPTAPGYQSSYSVSLTASFKARCFRNESSYSVLFTHTGTEELLVGSFAPTPFQPGRLTLLEKSARHQIKPRLDEPHRDLLGGQQLPIYAAEQAEFRIELEDKWQCGHRIPDAQVTVNAALKVNAGDSHKHIVTGDVGTGQMSAVDPFGGTISASDADEPGANDQIVGMTNANGAFEFRYTAGVYGVNERIAAVARNDITNSTISDVWSLQIAADTGLRLIDTSA
jgi:hypothetical protein